MGTDRLREVLIVVEYGDDLANVVAGKSFEPIDLVGRGSAASDARSAVQPEAVLIATSESGLGFWAIGPSHSRQPTLVEPSLSDPGNEPGAESTLTTCAKVSPNRAPTRSRSSRLQADAPVIRRCAWEYDNPSASASQGDCLYFGRPCRSIRARTQRTASGVPSVAPRAARGRRSSSANEQNFLAYLVNTLEIGSSSGGRTVLICNDCRRRVYRKRKSSPRECRVQRTERVAEEGAVRDKANRVGGSLPGCRRVDPDAVPPSDSGLQALCLIARLHHVSADPAALAHRLGWAPDYSPRPEELVLAARELGLRRQVLAVERRSIGTARSSRRSQSSTTANGVAVVVVLAQCDGQRVLFQDPSGTIHGGRPVIESLAAFAERWGGVLILVTSRASLAGKLAKFDFSWFVPSLVKYRRLFGHVLVVSLFLQCFALVSPLFFQVVMDKVLVHRGLTTLDVLVIGLGGARRVRKPSHRLANLRLQSHHEPHRRRAGRAALPTLGQPAVRLLPVAAGR